MMKRTYVTTFLCIVVFANLSSQSVTIRGKMDNSSNKKVTLCINKIDEDILFAKYGLFDGNEKYETRLNRNGEFSFDLNNVNQLHYNAYLKIGSQKIHIGIEPYDSVYILVKRDSVVFSGAGSEKNYFINYYYGEVIPKRNTGENNLKLELAARKTYDDYSYDIKLLTQYVEKYRIDRDFADVFGEIIKYYFFNTFLQNINEDFEFLKRNYSSLLDSFDYNNKILKSNSVYHSALSGYLDYKLFCEKNIKYNFCKDLDKVIEYSNSTLNDSLRDYHWSYILGYYLWICPENKMLNKKILVDYLNNSRVVYLKEQIREKARDKKIIE